MLFRGGRITRLTLSVGAFLAATLSAPAFAQDKVPAPPFLMADARHVIVGVVWDAAAVRKVLPPGVRPAADMTGGVNIYTVARAQGMPAYQSAYYWVDVEGFDSPQGVKGRFMLTGLYGPDAATVAALKTHYNLPIRNGTSRLEAVEGGLRAVANVGGPDIIQAEIKRAATPCQPAAVTLNYVSTTRAGGKTTLGRFPVLGENCGAELVALRVTAPAGDPFAAFPIVKTTWAAEFRNGIFSFPAAEVVGK